MKSVESPSLSRNDYIDPISFGYKQYLSITDGVETSAGMFLWCEDMIYKSEKSSYQLAAGSCAVEAALHPLAGYGLKDRLDLIQGATLYWDKAFEQEIDARNDIAERARWALCQVPTYNAIATFMEKGELTLHDYQHQEGLFKGYFKHILERWPHEELDGHVLESLTSYFLHRSNRVLSHEMPLYSIQSCVRDDYHAQSNKRVDVDVYNLQQGLKYGIQVKGGRVTDPHGNDNEHHRIFFSGARKLLCLPYTEGAIHRNIEAIISDDPEHRNDLDTIAADHRARIKGYFSLPEYIGTPFANR